MSRLLIHHSAFSVQRSARAFTLLEVIAATTMFAVLIGVVYGIFYSSLRLRQNAYDAFEADLPQGHVIETIRQDLASAVVPKGLLAGAMTGEKQEQGSARFDTLKIHTASGSLTDSKPWPDIQRVEYSLEQPEAANDTGQLAAYDLVRKVYRNLLASTEEEPEEQRLIHNVQLLQFTYYDGQSWLDSWDSSTQDNQAPQAVKVHIEFANSETAKRPTLPVEIVVPIMSKAVTSGQGQTATTTGGSGQ